MKRLFTLLVILPSVLFGQTAKDSLTIEMSKMTGDTAIVGFAVAVIDQGGILYEHGFGYADLGNDIPYTINTVQPIASISKTLIGVSLLKAQELKLLHLDDDINKYLPYKIINPNHPSAKITIRQLSNHTSSLRDTKHYEKSYIFQSRIPKIYKEFPFGLKRFIARKIVRGYNMNTEITLHKFLANLYLPEGQWYSKKSFGKEAPGTKVSYSNNGAALASMVIEQASGLTYTEFVQKYILTPLKMQHSGWDINDFEVQDQSKLYPFYLEIPYYKLITLADGGFITSVHDFSKYFSAIMRGYNGESNLLNTISYDQMLKLDTIEGQGVFWSVDELGDGNYIGHSGGDPGVHTIAVFDKRSNLGFICFSNTNTFSSDKVEEALKTMFRYAPKIQASKAQEQ